jgi:hypothetical protein
MGIRIAASAALWSGPALLTLALSGCSGPDAVVQGKVTRQGQPVASAEVAFAAKDDPNQQFFGVTDSGGALFLTYRDRKGLPPGPYTIRITSVTQRDGQPLPSGEEGAVIRQSGNAVTQIYVFEKDLVVGDNNLDLKLEEAQVEAPAPDDGANSGGP